MYHRTEPRIASAGLADALRERTRSLHRQAESCGIVHELLRGTASRHGYALLLRNLLPAYRELETGLERLRQAPGVRAIAYPALGRSHAIESDLAQLWGAAWRRTLPLLEAGARYARAVAAAAEGEGVRLIGHAYVRYLGDLNGGRLMKERLRRTLGLSASQLGFYEFPAIADLDLFRARYREAFDRVSHELPGPEPILDEAVLAFRLNIELSNAVQGSACVV